MTTDLSTSPRDPHLYELVKSAVVDGMARVRNLQSEGKFISEYYDFPSLSWSNTGFPSITYRPFSGSTDYSSAFALKRSAVGGGDSLVYDEIETFENLVNYVRVDERLNQYFSTPNPSSPLADSMLTIGACHIPTQLINRYLHLYNSDEVTDERLRPLYLEMEARVFEDQLPVDFLIPIVLTKFENDGPMELATNVWLERMDDATQLARVHRLLASPVHHTVFESATHALTLKQQEVRSWPFWSWPEQDLNLYPLQTVDRFFEALRLVTGVDTGYAQLLLRPLGWAEGYKANLPALVLGPAIRRYPQWFDDYGWLKERKAISTGVLRTVGKIFERLDGADPRIALASRRLSASMLRTDEEDIILDLCIGLESLVGDESTTEIRFKLALRVAAVYGQAVSPPQSPINVFDGMKQIYDYRSAVIHGSRERKRKKRLVTGLTQEPIPAVSLATQYLRVVLLVLLRNPELLDPAVIDTQLVVKSLPSGAQQ